MCPDPATVCDEYGELVDRLARRTRHGNREVDIEDVRQEMWLGVLLALRRYRPERGPLKGYVAFGARKAGRRAVQAAAGRGMARCGAAGEIVPVPPPLSIHVRPRSGDPITATLPDRPPAEPPDAPGPDLWERAAPHLTPAELRVATLHFRDGLGWKRIAAEAGVPRATVRRLVGRAVAKLRAAMIGA